MVWLKLSTSLLSFISKINLPVPRMWLANPHSILRGGFSLSRAKAVFIPPAKLVVVARSSYPRTTGKASGGMLCPFYILVSLFRCLRAVPFQASGSALTGVPGSFQRFSSFFCNLL